MFDGLLYAREDTMTPTEVAEWLQEMWTNSPIPDSGEQSYRFLRSRVERVVDDRREEL